MRQMGMKVLYSAEEEVAVISYAGSPGERGWLRIIDRDEPAEFEAVVADDILQHTAHLGVVEVKVVKTKKGTEYDIEQAIEDSKALLVTQDEKRFMTWVQSMVDDYIKRQKPVPPPDESILRVMERRNYDPKKYGIVPFGWEDPTAQIVERDKKHAEERTEWQKQSEKLQAQIDLLSKQVAGK